MRKYVREVLLWLFIIDLGIALGAGIYESRVVIPQWQNTPPQTWPNTGLQFWVYVTTVPLTLLTLANLVAAWMEQGPRRYWWLGAAAISVVGRIWTFSYFIPTMIRLMSAEDLPEAEVNATLSQWLLLDYGRHALTLAALLAALKALSLPGERSR
jgi:Anthrone oxygenase